MCESPKDCVFWLSRFSLLCWPGCQLGAMLEPKVGVKVKDICELDIQVYILSYYGSTATRNES